MAMALALAMDLAMAMALAMDLAMTIGITLALAMALALAMEMDLAMAMALVLALALAMAMDLAMVRDKRMRPDREIAIEVMRNMGWTATRTKLGSKFMWEFRREDTGGLQDVIRRRQDQLSTSFVVDIAMRCGDAPDLVKELSDVKERWIQRKRKAR